ncbi:MAG: SH3 domain-containing protein [Treponema sp.]|nr:SH3 domain-containing protein [Treponema sp.]
MKKIVLKFAAVFAALFIFALTSCSGIIGYSVVLWNIGEQKVTDGTVVPVYLKSNISHVYVISTPDSEEKFEVPLWKLSEPVSKGKAKKLAKQYGAYEHQYARCKLDGLPIRAEPNNVARQIYRLRKGEVIRALERGEGNAPTNGVAKLEGEWLHVLTSNGVWGWCFSLNLELFAMKDDGSFNAGTEAAAVSKVDDLLQDVLEEKWYPEYYDTMHKKGRVDLNYVKQSYGFEVNTEKSTVRLDLPGTSVSYTYTDLKRVGNGSYDFKDTPIHITIKDASTINVRYNDDTGITKSQNMLSSQVIDPSSLIAGEKSRRAGAYSSLRSSGPDYSSSSYGMIAFSADNNFTWSGYSILVPSVIPEDAGTSGKVSFPYFLPSNLKGEWNGVVTLTFSKGAEVNLLYKLDGTGLRLSPARVVTVENPSNGFKESSVSKSSGSLEMFFHK